MTETSANGIFGKKCNFLVLLKPVEGMMIKSLGSYGLGLFPFKICPKDNLGNFFAWTYYSSSLLFLISS